MIKNIFLALKKKIETELPGVKVYRYSANLLNKMDDEPLYIVPSVHIQFTQIETKTMTHKIQQAEVAVIIHVVCENYMDNETNEAMEKVIDYAEQVHSKLHLFACQLSYITGIGDDEEMIFNAMHRQRMVVDNEPTNIDITEMHYKFIAYDTDNVPIYIVVDPVSLNITTEFVD